jgi:hypothetical protein
MTMARLIFTKVPGITKVPGNWHTVDFPYVPLIKVAWDTRPSHALAYVFFGHVNIDFDGSPTAYGPAKMNPDDALGNAGNASQGWFGVASYAKTHPLVKNKTIKIDQEAPEFQGKFPVVQQERNGDPKPGYYVSSTPHPVGHDYLQNSYVDASKVAFGALDKRLIPLGVHLGDFGLAIRHDKTLQSGFYYEDMGGTKFALGECSQRVWKDLGGVRLQKQKRSATPSVRIDLDDGKKHTIPSVPFFMDTGKFVNDNNFPVSFIIFPRSSVDPMRRLMDRPVGQLGGAAGLSDKLIEDQIRPLLFELSRASNANDLPLLMALNEAVPPHRPQGKELLDARNRVANLGAPQPPKPANYATIKIALALFGFRTYSPTPKQPPTKPLPLIF